MRTRKKFFLFFILTACFLLGVCSPPDFADYTANGIFSEKNPSLSSYDTYVFEGKPYIELNGNQPAFREEDYTTDPFEKYAQLDSLGRCGVAYANICPEIMPTGEREAIGQIKPSGWHTVKYEGIVEGNYLYNRCHLIAYTLSGENANELNLITGTRYMNTQGMLPFENKVADYVKSTGNHVLYRVTPVFEGKNLVASGVIMEAYSVEDAGEGICFHVYVFNCQPGIEIDYSSGESRLSDAETGENDYVLNTNTHKFHDPSCSGVADIREKNKENYTGSRDILLGMGYEPCQKCNP